MALTFGILTVSDTCFKGQAIDKAGPRLELEIQKAYPDAKILHKHIVPDEVDIIISHLHTYVMNYCNVILTTGGTGFSSRDVTPEATKQVIDKEANGLSYAMLSKSLEITDFAMLSRAVCGIKDQSIIINLPGSEKAASECFNFISKSLKHAVQVLLDKSLEVKKTHLKLHNPKRLISKVKINAADRNRNSIYPMLEMDNAMKVVLRECAAETQTEEIPVEDSIYRILCEDIYSKEPIPPFDASVKDGYAVKAADGAGVRKVRSTAAAGDAPISSYLEDGEIIRISTGAPIPSGADAVVQVEDTKLVKKCGQEEILVSINVTPKIGQDIRKIGSDIEINTLVIKASSKITAAHIGVLTMLGHTKIKVYKHASVGIISTGNELCNAGEQLKPGQIRDSNKSTLINLLKEYHFHGTDCGIARDNPDDVYSILSKAFEKNDIVITSGGVSMGEFDVIKQVLVDDFNAEIHFGRINMKPGKPTTFATLIFNGRRKYFFGLPGNPVSSGVTCVLFVIPVLRKLENSADIEFPVAKCILKDNIKNNDVRPEYVRVAVTYNKGVLEAYSTGSQVSSRLNSLLGANGLLIVPGKTENTVGKEFDTLIISNMYFAA